MKTDQLHQLLHLLRNPYGHNFQELRNAELRAADELEQLHRRIDICAKQWDGCTFDAPGGDIDIGQAIRATLEGPTQ